MGEILAQPAEFACGRGGLIMGFFIPRRERFRIVFSGIGKSAVIYPSTLLVALGSGMLNLGLIFFMRDVYGASPGLIGWFMSFGTLVYVAGCIFLGPLFDRYKPRYLMIGATAGSALFLVLLHVFRFLPLTFLFFGLQQLSVSFFWPPVMGWLSQNMEGKTLNKAMSRFNLSWSFGLLISPSLAGFLSERNPALPVSGAIILFAGTLLLITGAALAVPAISRNISGGKITATDTGEKPEDSSTPLRFSAWIGLFAGFIVTGMIITVFPLFARDTLLLSKSMVGNLLSLRVFARIIGFFLLGRLSFWHFRGRYQVASIGSLMILMLLMTRVQTTAFFALLIAVASMSNAFNYANSMFHSVAGSSRRAGRLAIHESLLAGGYIVGSAAGGTLYQHYSFMSVVVFCAASCGAAMIAQVVFLVRIRKR